MRILFVSMMPFETGVSATIRNKGIVRGLFDLGHDISTLTLKPQKQAIHYDETMNDIDAAINKMYYFEPAKMYSKLMMRKGNAAKEKGKKRILSPSVNIKAIRHFIKKIYDRTYIFDAQKANVKNVSRLNINYSEYDIIISSSDPKSSHLIVKHIFKKNKHCTAKWVQYWGDPMYIDITRKRDWRDEIVKYQEKKLLKRAHKIVYTSPLTLIEQQKLFPRYASKMDYVNQACTVYSSNQDSAEKIGNKDVSIGYFGDYVSEIRDIEPLYNVAIKNNIKLNICGGSDKVLQSRGTVSVEASAPYNEIIKKESETDILVCICNKKGTQIPGKIYYCAGYNKPLIVIIDGEYREKLRAYFESFERYILCENNEESILTAIEEAKIQIKSPSFKIGERFSAEYVGKRILHEIV